MELTEKQIRMARSKGASSVVKRIQVLKRKRNRTSSDEEQCEQMTERILELIGESATEEDKTESNAKALQKKLEEICHPFIEQYDRGELDAPRLIELCKSASISLSGEGKFTDGIEERRARMRRFKGANKEVKMFSRKLNKEIAVISDEKQRKNYPDITVYTIDEAIMMTEPDMEHDIAAQKLIDQVKCSIDGELIGVN